MVIYCAALALRCSAQRRFCAAAMRLRAASLRTRFLRGSDDAVDAAYRGRGGVHGAASQLAADVFDLGLNFIPLPLEMT